MSVPVDVSVQLDDSSARARLTELDRVLRKIAEKKYTAKVDAAGAEIAAKNIAYLTSSAAKFDAQIKSSEAAAKRFAAALQSQMQAEQAAEAAHEGMASSMNGVDQMIQRNEASARAFSAALREQMQAEQAAEAAHEGMASSMNVIDQAIKASETASRNFSNALQKQMEEEQKAETETKDLADGWSVLGGAIATALGSLASRAVHMALSKITQGIREALTTMKDVDTQLTNISKVSGITGKALSDMGERAYETASKYGVAADEYLSAVYTFQKAGLGESAEAMGELAVKTMLVGDTTADVASQFLISANAAWEYGGNMEKLNQLVDEADYINNNYATDLQKLSQGLPRVASVAAQAGMSAEETMAALGTITAVTQESGTKSATALRALILNIEKEVGEYVDETGESFTVTEESVKSMQGLMEKYAKTELEAAKATGEMINPMTAIKAIFEGIANNDMNDRDLFALLSGMGGKLRTNQLTALVKNYELFDEMLGKIANSAGTADGEITLMMESWERKTQVLKNTWTEFIADVVSTEFMKDTVEGLTAIVEAMDSLVERGDNPWYQSDKTNEEIESTEKKIEELSAAIQGFTWEGPNAEQTLHDLEVELQIQQEILETKKKQYDLEHAEETKKLQKELTRGYLNLDGSYTRVDIEELYSLGERIGKIDFLGNISEYQENLKTILSDFSDYYDKVQQVKDAGGELTEEQKQFLKNYELVNNLAEQQGLHIGEQVDGYWQLVDSTGKVVASVKDITKEQEDQQKDLEGQLNGENFWTRLGESLQEYESGVQDATGQTEGISTAVKTISFQEAIAGALKLASALGQAAANASDVHVGAIGHVFASGTKNAPAGPALVNELGPELISENGKAYIANGGKPAVVNLSKGAIVLPANVTKEALKGGMPVNAFSDGTTDYGTGLRIPTPTETGGGGSHPRPHTRQEHVGEGTVTVYGGGRWQCPNCGTINAAGAKKCSKCGAAKPSSGKPQQTGGGGGKKKKSKKEKAQEAAEKLSEKLKNLDKQAELALNRKQYDKAISIYKQAISLIKKQINVYKKAGYKEKSNEILDLRNMIFDYEAKIESAQKAKTQAQEEDLEGKTSETLSNLDSQASLARDEERWDDEADIYNQAMSLIDQQIEAYRAAGYDENSNEILDLKKRRKDYEKKLKDVAKAKEDAIKSQIVGDSDERLSNIGAQISLAESEKRYEDEKKLYEDAIGIIDQQISAYKAAGYDENSDEVLALRQKRKDYEDKLTDVTKAIIEGESGAVLDNLSRQASLARTEKRYKDEAALYEEAIAIVNRQIEAYKAAGYGENSDEILELRSNLIDLQEKRKSVEQSQWDDLLDALKSDIDAQSQAEQLAERQKALEEAQQALENVGKQRTVRVFNASTGQWEWVSDANSTKNAQGNLESAQKSYDEYIRSRALADMQKARDEGLAFDMGNLGPQVSASALARLNSPEVLEYAKKLDAIYGGATFQDLVAVGTGTANGGDSHDTIYNFGNITMSEAEARSTTVADLARRLSVLKIS